MKKYINTLLFVLLLGLFGNAQNVIEASLHEIMSQRDGEMIDVNIILKSQADADELRVMAERANDDETRKDVIIRGLKEYSKKEQTEILSILDAEKRNNRVSDINCHWLVNSINCKASVEVIHLLAEHPAVLIIGHNEQVNVLEDVKMEKAEATRGVTSHVSKVNADKAWNIGYTGKGVVVAVLDTGTNFDHTDINSDNLWDGGSEYPHHGYNVVDPLLAPYDDNGHGSHCAGIVCGTGVSGSQTGIAPDATLMTVKVATGEGVTSLEYMTTGIEFAVENGADVMSISIGWQNPEMSVSTSFRKMFENTLELGVLSSVAAGNDKDELMFYPVPKNINSPGNCPPAWIHPDQESNAGGLSGIISVGAIENNDAAADFSSKGPVTWQDSKWGDYPYNPGIGLIRPDISAPGVEIVSLSHNDYDGYIKLSGTSMATPCIAGVIALLLEKNPDFTPSDLCRLIETTAVKLSDTKSNTTGSGCVDALAAVTEGKEIPYLSFASCNPEVTLTGNDKDLTVKLINNGSAATTSSTNVTLSTDDSYVSIVNETVAFGAMETNGTASGTFRVNIDTDAPVGHVIDFKISATYNDNGDILSFADDFSIEINSLPYIRYYSCTPDVLTSLDATDIVISMFNNGNVATTDNSIVTLSTTDQYLTIVEEEAIYGPMTPNESHEGTFTVLASPLTPDNHIFDMKLTTILENNYAKQNVQYDFEDATKEGWTSIDSDGDGFGWFESNTLLGAGYGNQNSKYCMFSQSYTNDNGGMILYPDNYLVSPMKILVEDDTEFSFYACAQDMMYPYEHFGVAVSTTGNTSGSDFTTIAEWTMTAKTGHATNDTRKGNKRTPGSWYRYSVDLNDYAGEEIWIAIRHFNCSDQYFLAVDDIEITNINLPVSWEENITMKFKSFSPHIELSSYTPEILLNGDNDVDITVINSGTADMTEDVNVILSTENEFITIENNNMVYPPMNVGQTETKTFNVNVDPSVPNGQVVTFNLEALPNDNIETSMLFDFNSDMNDWTYINANHDDHTWYHSSNYDLHDVIPVPSHSGYGHLMSESYCNATYAPLSPDDYIVSPMMVEVTENTTFSFWACAQDEIFSAEHFGVAVSTKGNTSSTDFTTIAEWTMTAKSGQTQEKRSTDGTRYGQWYQYTVELDEYIGQRIWLAIRHFNTTNKFCLCVDDIEINNFVKTYNWRSTFTMTVANDNLAPNNLNAEVIDNTSIRLEWGGVEEAESYNIYRDGEYLCNVATTSYIDSELAETEEYCYSVTCIIDGNESGHSNTACAVTLSSVPECSAPTNITANVEENVYNFQYFITLTWDEVPNAMSYVIYANNSFVGVMSTPSFETGVNASGEIKYNIMTNCGEDGSSELSEDIIVTLGSGEESCDAPVNLQATVEENAPDFNYVFRVTLTWDAVADANSYNVYIDDELFGEVTTNSFVVGSDNEGILVFKVTSNCDNGESDMSQALSVDVKSIGLNEYESRLDIFPNPVTDKLYINGSDTIDEVSIFNVTGVMIYKESDLTDNEIDMSNLGEGLYIIKIKTNNCNVVKRFIKK